jgi:DUF2934 family protein
MTEKRWNEQQSGGELSGRIEKIRGKLLNDESVRNQISGRAYELYLSRGGQHGHQMEDWVQAENEILTPLIERELKGSSEARIARAQEGGAGSTTAPAAETPAPRKVPTSDEGRGGGITSTKPVTAGATNRPAAETPAPKKAPTRDEDRGGRIASTKASGGKRTRRKSPEEESPN